MGGTRGIEVPTPLTPLPGVRNSSAEMRALFPTRSPHLPPARPALPAAPPAPQRVRHSHRLLVLIRGEAYRLSTAKRHKRLSKNEVLQGWVPAYTRWATINDKGPLLEQASALLRFRTHLIEPLRSSGWRVHLALSAYTQRSMHPVLLDATRALQPLRFDAHRLLDSAPEPNQVLSILNDLEWALGRIEGSGCRSSKASSSRAPSHHRHSSECRPLSVLLIRVDVLFLRAVTKLPSPLDADSNPRVLLPLPVCGHEYPDESPFNNIWDVGCTTHRWPRLFDQFVFVAHAMVERFRQALSWLNFSQAVTDAQSLHWLTAAPQMIGAGVGPVYTCSEWNGLDPVAANWSNWSMYTQGLYSMVGRQNPLNNWTGIFSMWSPELTYWLPLSLTSATHKKLDPADAVPEARMCQPKRAGYSCSRTCGHAPDLPDSETEDLHERIVSLEQELQRQRTQLQHMLAQLAAKDQTIEELLRRPRVSAKNVTNNRLRGDAASQSFHLKPHPRKSAASESKATLHLVRKPLGASSASGDGSRNATRMLEMIVGGSSKVWTTRDDTTTAPSPLGPPRMSV
jgi:hypothetical protein